ncbi:putative RNA processing protein Grc3 [Aspergillus mulundensis]|uniref:Polynucleotide 5'-hydroxyl-kinase GRC3 n=1 Tax=Aspergillus mulundensis TaxID=1810919 RepID=A0A3D8REF3_9EURO|nr:Polynucleotide 5'-hydroxyl-kinase grc3 [Aspergillus mulundensis]RDW72298.1 Polynucleotide 5'-hydroxyl-kinase grc3 [Aspergillus mulundensis]
MTKRKAEKQAAIAGTRSVSWLSSDAAETYNDCLAPISAFAARKARLQQTQTQTVVTTETTTHTEPAGEPPSKKPRRSLEESQAQSTPKEDAKRTTKRGTVKVEKTQRADNGTAARETRRKKVEVEVEQRETEASSSEESEGEDAVEENAAGVIAVPAAEDGCEFPADNTMTVEFPLSKMRLNKSNIVYSDEDTLCVRIREKLSIVLIGHYDLWVKRGVVSLMGAKLHPSPRVYRVYAPSTHSLPVIKCVTGVDGGAEVEFKSCHSGITRLRDLSPLYQRVWNSGNTPADKLSLKMAGQDARRTFSVLHTSADDSLKRHLRPLHLEKQWSAAIKVLSQRAGRLQVLVCGPKASGKSTFGRYLLNHLLSPAPQTETNYANTDGVAFLDLDPGQPEFMPMGQVYLAHLRSPVFGPPFTHPSLNNEREGSIIRAHHIGATSPKEDPDHYVLAATNLMEQYRALLATYPQCPLIINYPGWIFGTGLEVATYLIRSLGLSDVVYMSEKGPMEVVEPLSQAASASRTPLTILPSQPTEFVSRSSAQLRSMQMQSYFHMAQPKGVSHPMWAEKPVFKNRPFRVRYAGENRGVHGVMTLGSQISPELLCESLEGAVVGVVAVEGPDALPSPHPDSTTTNVESQAADNDDDETSNADVDMDDVDGAKTNLTIPHLATLTTPTKESLPYISTGPGSSTPLHPSSSSTLGLAIVRSINPTTQTLDLVTPIAPSRLIQSLEQGHALVLVRGVLDNPNWAVAEEYYGARAEDRRVRRNIKRRKDAGDEDDGDAAQDQKVLGLLKERIRRAKEVPFMTVVEDHGRRRQEEVEQQRALWKLRKKAGIESEDEVGY